jgi:hypothetical protein
LNPFSYVITCISQTAEETEDDEVAAAGYEIFYTKAVDDSHIPKLNDTNFNTTVKEYDISVVFFFLPCKLLFCKR